MKNLIFGSLLATIVFLGGYWAMIELGVIDYMESPYILIIATIVLMISTSTIIYSADNNTLSLGVNTAWLAIALAVLAIHQPEWSFSWLLAASIFAIIFSLVFLIGAIIDEKDLFSRKAIKITWPIVGLVSFFAVYIAEKFFFI